MLRREPGGSQGRRRAPGGSAVCFPWTSSSRTSRVGPTAWELWSRFWRLLPMGRGNLAGAGEGVHGHRERGTRGRLAARRGRRGPARRQREHRAAVDRRRPHRCSSQPRRTPPVHGRRRHGAPTAGRARRRRPGGRLRHLAAAVPGPSRRAAGRARAHLPAGGGPARRAGRGGACALRPHRSAALRHLPRRRRPPASRRLDGRRRPGPRPPGSGVGDERVGARRRRPRRRPCHLPPGRRQGTRPAGQAGAPASRLPLTRVGAHGPPRRARRCDRAERCQRPRFHRQRGRARRPGPHLRGGRRR